MATTSPSGSRRRRRGHIRRRSGRRPRAQVRLIGAPAPAAPPWDDDEVRRQFTIEQRTVEGLCATRWLPPARRGRDGLGHSLSSADQHPGDLGSETPAWETSSCRRAPGSLTCRPIERLDAGNSGSAWPVTPIPAARLDALPVRPFCIDDAQLAERETLRNDYPGTHDCAARTSTYRGETRVPMRLSAKETEVQESIRVTAVRPTGEAAQTRVHSDTDRL